MDLVTFRAKYPEFASAKDPMVQTFLDSATLRTDASVWGSLTDEGIGYLAAHLLATAPNGQFARLQVTAGKGVPPGRTLYADQRQQLEMQVCVGLRGT